MTAHQIFWSIALFYNIGLLMWGMNIRTKVFPITYYCGMIAIILSTACDVIELGSYK